MIERWTKGCILPFPKKGDLRIAKNYSGIILASMAAKIYNVLLVKHIEPEIEKILKNQNDFQRKRSTSQILTIYQILGVCVKNLKLTLLFIDFSKTFESIHRGKMEQILLAYGLPKEIVAAIMILCKKHESKSSPTRRRHRLSWYCCLSSARGYISPISVYNLLRLCTSNVDRSNERKWIFTLNGGSLKPKDKFTLPIIWK